MLAWYAVVVCPSVRPPFIVKDEGLLKLTGSQVDWNSGNISETVLDKELKML